VSREIWSSTPQNLEVRLGLSSAKLQAIHAETAFSMLSLLFPTFVCLAMLAGGFAGGEGRGSGHVAQGPPQNRQLTLGLTATPYQSAANRATVSCSRSR